MDMDIERQDTSTPSSSLLPLSDHTALPIYNFALAPAFNVTAALLNAGLPVSLTLAAATHQH